MFCVRYELIGGGIVQCDGEFAVLFHIDLYGGQVDEQRKGVDGFSIAGWSLQLVQNSESYIYAECRGSLRNRARSTIAYRSDRARLASRHHKKRT